MYGLPSYMVSYGSITAPTLPSGKKFPKIYYGDTNESVKANSGIDNVVTFYAQKLREKIQEKIDAEYEGNLLKMWNLGELDPATGDVRPGSATIDVNELSDGENTFFKGITFITDMEYNPNPTEFSDNMDAATQMWQMVNNLGVDGIVGTNTWASLGLQGRNSRSGSASSGGSSSSGSSSSDLPDKKPSPLAVHWRKHQNKYYITLTSIFVLGAISVAIFYPTTPKKK